MSKLYRADSTCQFERLVYNAFAGSCDFISLTLDCGSDLVKVVVFLLFA